MKRRFLSALIAANLILIPTTTYASENVSLNRLSGKDRYETSMAIANEFEKQVGSIDSIILASGDNFPDALSGTTLCKKYNAPLLLINSKNKHKVLDFVYKNLRPKTNVYILGGTGAIDDSIATELNSRDYKVKRLAGKNRFETNNAIVDEMNVKKGTPIFVCNGGGFADALSASPVAGNKGYPIILVNKDSISEETKAQIRKINPSKFYVIGGYGAVSNKNIDNILNECPDSQFQRIGGKSRYETSQNLNEEFNLWNRQEIALANGSGFADALSGAGLASIKGEGIKLININGVNNNFNNSIKKLDVLGGLGVLPNRVINLMDPNSKESKEKLELEKKKAEMDKKSFENSNKGVPEGWVCPILNKTSKDNIYEDMKIFDEELEFYLQEHTDDEKMQTAFYSPFPSFTDKDYDRAMPKTIVGRPYGLEEEYYWNSVQFFGYCMPRGVHNPYLDKGEKINPQVLRYYFPTKWKYLHNLFMNDNDALDKLMNKHITLDGREVYITYGPSSTTIYFSKVGGKIQIGRE